MTDDQTVAQYRAAMPCTRRFFAERGTNFTEAIATPPLCCPARAGFLTGQYPHNHGVFRNTPGYPACATPRTRCRSGSTAPATGPRWSAST